MLACFGDGQPNQDRLTTGSQGCLRFRYLQKTGAFEKTSKSAKRLVIAEASDGTSFVGSNFSGGIGTQSTPAGVQYFVGCFDPASSALKLIDCAEPMFTLTRRREDEEAPEDMDLGPISQNTLLRTDGRAKAMAKKDLIETFGSRKAKRAKRSRENGRITVDSISTETKELLEKRKKKIALKKASGSDETDLTASAFMTARRKMLPPFDLAATKLENAFDLAAVISADDAKALVPSVNSLRKELKKPQSALQEGNEKSAFSPFIRRQLLGLRQIGPKLQQKRLVRVAFLNALIQITALPRRIKSLADHASPPHLPAELLTRALGIFSQAEGNGAWNRTAYHTDKLLIYCCMLALVLENFSIDPSLLASELHVSTVKLKGLFKELGCVPARAKKEEGKKAKTVMMLKLPLKFPIRRNRKQGR